MIDYDFWGSLPEYTLTQAAYLGRGLEPVERTGGHPPDVRALIDRIYQDTERGALPSRNTTGTVEGVFFWGDTYISHEHLKRWFERNGMRPAFLFPENRPKPEEASAAKPEKPLSTSERESYERTVGALVLLLVEQQQGMKFGTTKKPNVSAICQAISGEDSHQGEAGILRRLNADLTGQSRSVLAERIARSLQTTLET